MGTDWHQEAIRCAVTSLRDYARLRGLPWHIGDQLGLVATKPDGAFWRPCPDIMIHTQAGPDKRSEMVASRDGLPLAIIEVVSPSTWEYDVDDLKGKAFGYLALGVRNYLVFDPQGDLLGEPCRGWQRAGTSTRAWRPAPDGRYHPLTLDISFRPEGELLRVYDPTGQPVSFSFENADRAARIADLEAELARLRAENGSHH